MTGPLSALGSELVAVCRTRSLDPLRTPRSLGAPIRLCLLGALPLTLMSLVPAGILGSILAAQALATGTRDPGLEALTRFLAGSALALPLVALVAAMALGTFLGIVAGRGPFRDLGAALILSGVLLPLLVLPGVNLLVLAAWPPLTGALLARLARRSVRRGIGAGALCLLVGGLLAWCIAVIGLARYLDLDLQRRTLTGPPPIQLPEPPAPPPTT